MADHLDKQIRAAFVTAVTGLSTTGSRVFDSRPDDIPLQATELPGIKVRVGARTRNGDDPDVWSNTRAFSWVLTIHTELCVKANTGYADTLAQILKEIEVALAADRSLGVGAKDIAPLDVGEPEISGEGEKTVASVTADWGVWYVSAFGAPDVPL